MGRVLAFLFGGGWWTFWYILLHLWLLPLGVALNWARQIVPGAGPQGGEAVFAFYLLAVLGLIAMSVVDAVLWATTIEAAAFVRWIAVPFGVLVAWPLGLWLLFSVSGWMEQQTGDTMLETPALALQVAFYAVAHLLNLLALARFRGL